VEATKFLSITFDCKLSFLPQIWQGLQYVSLSKYVKLVQNMAQCNVIKLQLATRGLRVRFQTMLTTDNSLCRSR